MGLTFSMRFLIRPSAFSNHTSKTHRFCSCGIGQTDRRIAPSLNARYTFNCAGKQLLLYQTLSRYFFDNDPVSMFWSSNWPSRSRSRQELTLLSRSAKVRSPWSKDDINLLIDDHQLRDTANIDIWLLQSHHRCLGPWHTGRVSLEP